MKDPNLTIYELLRDNWDNSNTSISSDPNISTGWFDSAANSPQVTVSGLDEVAVGGVDAPFSGIQGDGSGPVQEFVGTIEVNCWSSRELNSSVNPKKLLHEFYEEVLRIINNNTTSATDLRFIGVSSKSFFVDTDAEPAVFRYLIEVDYAFRKAT